MRVGVLDAFDQDDINAEPNDIETPGYTLVSAELTTLIKGENLVDDDVLNYGSFKHREKVLLPDAGVKVFGKAKFN